MTKVIESPIATDFSDPALFDAMLALEAPSYIVRVHPHDYDWACNVIRGRYRFAVIGDSLLEPNEWYLDRHDHGEITLSFHSPGVS